MAKDPGAPTIFDYLNQIYNKTTTLPYCPKTASPHMLALWLSHDESLLPIVDKLNEMLYNLPDEQVYNYLFSKIPKGRRFLKWTKKVKDEKFDPKELQDLYGYSKQEAKLYRRLFK